MKIILSPSKTKHIQGVPTQPLWQPEKVEGLVTHMQKLSTADIAKALKIKEDKAIEVAALYKNFAQAPVGKACESYSGLAFKNLNWQGLSKAGQAFGEEHLVILSGLYGVVQPGSPIKEYRLDFVDRIEKVNVTAPLTQSLYEYWQASLQDYFAKEDWILNLASKEYSAGVAHPHMVTVEFQDWRKDQWRQGSTSSKIMRGQLAHRVLSDAITKLEELPEEIGAYRKMPRETESSIIYRQIR